MDMLEVLPQRTNNRLLEIGAASGETLLAAKESGLAQEIVGIELMRLEDSKQSHPMMDRFIIGDVEKMDLPFENDYFDAILCGDVLEHLTDPWSTIKRLIVHLKPGGVFIASLPNFREIKTLMNIVVKGDFAYSDAGILDRTHQRFFCKKNMVEMFERNSLTVTGIKSNLDIQGKGKRMLLNRLTLRLFAEFLESEYLIVAKKLR
jgi:2-polyprenyl-3-methyl-5-hydroxy-6-metoxy-1,4-benzoquinol methylase